MLLAEIFKIDTSGNEFSRKDIRNTESYAQNDFQDVNDIISTSQPLNLHRDSEERLPATQRNVLCSTCSRMFKTTQ